jgi:hypothetical protein
MKRSTKTAEPGDQFLNEDNDLRCTIVDIETCDGYRVALLQYEDGGAWEEVIENESLPTERFQRLPSMRGGGPTLRESCDPDKHVFDAEPAKHMQEHAKCKHCGLSAPVIEDFLTHPTWDRAPAICWTCERELKADDTRLFTQNVFICPDCCGDAWNAYLGAETDEMHEYLLYCENSPVALRGAGCGFIVEPTRDTTHRFLHPPYDYGVDEDPEPDLCPKCGGELNVLHTTFGIPVEALEQALGVDILGDDISMAGVFPDGETTRILTDDEIEAYYEILTRLQKERQDD